MGTVNETLLDFIEANKSGFDVSLLDQTTPPLFIKFNTVHKSTTLAQDALLYSKVIVVEDATSIVAGNYIIMFCIKTNRVSFFTATNVTTNTITLDSPIDVAYSTGTFVDGATTDMTVNGSVTPVTFGLRGLGVLPGVLLKVDITKIIITCVAASPVDLTTFADIAALGNGLLMRCRNGDSHNIFNVKTNRDISGLMTLEVTAALNPAQGEDGFKSELQFAGQSEVGVVIRLAVGEDLEAIVQDNLTGVTALSITAIVHRVED
jgi:hypothetical protein